MRLTTLKLAGFKSFVDPTVFQVPGSIVAIVGPNGCGKSNLIDAVRWVMGESAARQLRGESMEDVIFSGSAERRPVGQASIELVFDNSSGQLGGPWARYSEIAIKRQVSRGGQSAYFLNGTRCRRRDITDIFLGTGLGPRSYAIIEQGMISRIIESRPEELRVFLEETAGISRYKERRRETELRIQHTRDNLDRLTDLREELNRQLQHLQRQARNAEKYQTYRAEERRLKAAVLALRWREHRHELDRRQADIETRVTEQDRLLAEQRHLETSAVQARERGHVLREALEQAQAVCYRIGAEVSRLEQALAHERSLRQQRRTERERLEQEQRTLDAEWQQDEQRLLRIDHENGRIEQQLETARQALNETERQLAEREAAVHEAQQHYEDFTRRAAEPLRQAEVAQVRIDQLERQSLNGRQRAARLRQELDGFDPIALEQAQQQLTEQAELLREALAEARLQLETVLAEGERLRAEREAGEQQRRVLQTDYQTRQGRLASLQTLQQAALGERDTELTAWLQQQGLAQAPCLAEQLEVAPGWEAAVETVLQPWLDALCVQDIPALDPATLPAGRVALYSPASPLGDGVGLGARVRNAGALQPLLDAVTVLDEFGDDVLAQQAGASTTAVTRDGLWRGSGWLCRAGGEAVAGGVLVREREVRELQHQLSRDQDRLQALDQVLAQQDAALSERLEESRSVQEQVHRLRSEAEVVRHRIETGRQRLEQQRERRQRLEGEYRELLQELEEDAADLLDAREQLNIARQAATQLAQEQSQLEHVREQRRAALHQFRQQSAQQRQQVQQQTLQQQALHNERQALTRAMARLDVRRQELDGRWQAWRTLPDHADLGDLEQALETQLKQRLDSEHALHAAREAVARHEAADVESEQHRAQLERQLNGLREQLEQTRLAASETRVHCANLGEQLGALDSTPEQVLAELPDNASEQAWQTELERIGQRIQRLGAINLAAIDEHARLAERKNYLDSQDDDLRAALTTLEDAMRRIDHETRSRFRDTFDRVNAELQHLFPRLFGGGQAFLELTGGDTLDAGVALMARPPGKRIGRIQLLSGGEKALSALALVFAIFRLNPAPFCLLDEVDAPLDEANVGRFGRLVEELAQQVQFIIVTHNKTTMAMAHYLIGVTMHEPGVSRLVSVDVDEAVRLAAV